MENNTEKPKKKRMLGKFLKSVFGSPIVRALAKSIPGGSWAYEVAENIKHAREEAKAGEPLPHSAVSLLFQAVFLFMIVWAFFTGQITIQDIMSFISVDDFKSFGTPEIINVVRDTTAIK